MHYPIFLRIASLTPRWFYAIMSLYCNDVYLAIVACVFRYQEDIWDFDEVIKSYQASYTVNVSHWWNISRALCIFRLGARLDWGRLLWQSGADIWIHCMGLLPDTKNCRLRMRRECRKRFPHHWLQRKPLVSDPGMNHGTCVTHVPWCMSGSLTRGSG